MTMQLDTNYTNPYGLWKVWGDGGENWYQLGTYLGYVDDIAFALAENQGYNLRFEKVTGEPPTPEKYLPTVTVVFDGIDEPKDNKKRVAMVAKMLSGRGIEVKSSTIYNAVTLMMPDDRWNSIKREAALAKLTPHERALLGLV